MYGADMRNTLLSMSLLALASCGPSQSTIDHSSSSALGSSEEASADPGTPAPSGPKYEDAEQYLIDSGNDAAFTSWLNLRDTLRSNFDDVCGDTFCEGDYSNLVPVRLRCSVETATGKMKSCKYVFAGSYEDVNASTGSIKVTAKTFSCAVAVSGLPLSDFMSTLQAEGTTPALQRPLTSGGKSIYDNLVGCL